MPKLGKASLKEYATLHPDLQRLADAVIIHFDFKILAGHRGKAAQNAAFNAKPQRSKLRWPQSHHNSTPSDAMDLAPFPIDFGDSEAARQRFVLLAGFVLGTAAALGIPVRWGGDWDGDKDTRDEKFRDLGHIERIPLLPE